MKKLSLAQIGLLQALGVVIYCGLVAGFIMLMEKIQAQPPQYLVMISMLSLLVLSAATCGALVFGYAVYLALNQKIKEAIQLLGNTLLILVGFIIVIITVASILFI